MELLTITQDMIKHESARIKLDKILHNECSESDLIIAMNIKTNYKNFEYTILMSSGKKFVFYDNTIN
jgi:hypothetical protein